MRISHAVLNAFTFEGVVASEVARGYATEATACNYTLYLIRADVF